ncbi:hypothetical protein [Methanoregula sp.]|uniref:hypothetical protein n=1 Tax=Methanoregula sp. TaxID=2052170 RepID=UPI003569576C
MALTGIRQVGIGIFPENTRTPHLIAASLMFVSGGILAIAASRVFLVPRAWISGTLGIITLVAIILFEIKFCIGLGKGGMERIIADPLILWALGSGAVLMAPIKIVSAGSLPDLFTSHVFFIRLCLR